MCNFFYANLVLFYGHSIKNGCVLRYTSIDKNVLEKPYQYILFFSFLTVNIKDDENHLFVKEKRYPLFSKGNIPCIRCLQSTILILLLKDITLLIVFYDGYFKRVLL